MILVPAGRYTPLFRAEKDPKDIAVLPDGSILVAGYVIPSGGSDFAIVKYLNF